MGAFRLVVKHEGSGVHRLSDVVGKDETVAYHAPNETAAALYLQQVQGGRTGVRVMQPAVNGRGRAVSCPVDREKI